MRRAGFTLVRLVMGAVSTPFPETNLEMWVHLGEESWTTNVAILEIVQELNEMARLRAENEILVREQKKIMKSFSRRKNQRQPIPSPEQENMMGNKEIRDENTETEGDQENQEEELDNVSDHNKHKR